MVINSDKNLNSLQLHGLNNSEINFFEDSRLFFTKRYFFSNELKNNFWESQSIITTGRANTDNSLTNYMPLIYTKSLAFNTTSLINLQTQKMLNKQPKSEYLTSVDLDLASNTMLYSSNINFINSISTISSNNNQEIKISKMSPSRLNLPSSNSTFTI
jgi:hypothetical protein